ncbi:MAG: hypothetical protein AAF433_07505 [Bacteroidota bacterium]
MIRLLFVCSLLVVGGTLSAQFNTETIPLNGAANLIVEAYLSKVELLPSSSGQLEVLHELYVNGEARPADCELEINHTADGITISELRPQIEELEESWSNEDNGQGDGNRLKARLLIKVPAGMKLRVETYYGMVHAEDVASLEEVTSTYGEIELLYRNSRPAAEGLALSSEYGIIDLSLPGNINADVVLETNYGSLLTDFDIDINRAQSVGESFHQEVVGTIGRGGARLSCRSPYSNVYLRQTK